MRGIDELIGAVTTAVRECGDELTSLDQAIGDGDHGINMRRGFDAIAEQRAELASLAIGEALQKAGMTLVMKVGGASGPLYGSLLMAIGKAFPEELSPTQLAPALRAGVDAVKRRGKSDVGEKTMLEVLVPVVETLESSQASVWTPALLETLKESARNGLESTREMRALKGRASFLGDRSIGHLDPGARSSQLIVETVCTKIGGAL